MFLFFLGLFVGTIMTWILIDKRVPTIKGYQPTRDNKNEVPPKEGYGGPSYTRNLVHRNIPENPPHPPSPPKDLIKEEVVNVRIYVD